MCFFSIFIKAVDLKILELFFQKFVFQKTGSRLGTAQRVAVKDGILSCDFTRTVTQRETQQEANMMLGKQHITLATGSRSNDGKFLLILLLSFMQLFEKFQLFL